MKRMDRDTGEKRRRNKIGRMTRAGCPGVAEKLLGGRCAAAVMGDR